MNANIMIMAWGYHPPIGDLAALRAKLQFLKDLGINTILDTSHWWNQGFVNNPTFCANWGRYFDEAERYGIKIHPQIDFRTIVSQWKPFVPCISADHGLPFIVQFKDKPAYGGHFIADEPHCGRYYCDFDLKGDPAQHNPDAGRYYLGLTNAQIAEYYPYGLPQTRWIGYADHSPYGGHMQSKAQYDMVRGQDNTPVAIHPTWNVWTHGFQWKCDGVWQSIYWDIYTPASEIEDMGGPDIYPFHFAGSNWESWLRNAIGVSYTFPNGDGFSQRPLGVIACIQATNINIPSDLLKPKPGWDGYLVEQYKVWKEMYGSKLAGVGFYTAGAWMDAGEHGATTREQIKDVAHLEGWIEELPEEFTTEEITCPGCGAGLELTISSIPENNISQSCPVCGTSAD